MIYHHLHNANAHLTSQRLKTSPILSLGLQSVSESDSKSIARQLTFLLIFFLIPDHCLTKLVRVVIGTSATRGQQFEIEIHHSANPYHIFSVVYVSKIFSAAEIVLSHMTAPMFSQLDNHGNHMLLTDESPINVPGIAAAHVIKRYTAQAADEISLEV